MVKYIKFIDAGYFGSDNNMFWWDFECPYCGKTLRYKNVSMILRDGTVLVCEQCKKSYTIRDNIKIGDNK